jgi:hypothetical protein
MSTTMHAISAAALGLSLTFAAYAAEVAPTDSTPSAVQTEPRDTTRVPSSNEQSQGTPESRSDEPVKDGSAREDDVNYRVALQECAPLLSPERERCIEKAKEKYGRM